MKIQIIAGIAVLTSSMTNTEIDTAQKYMPSALTLKDEGGNPIFRVGHSSTAALTNYGAIFDRADADGYAQLALALPAEVADNAEAAKIWIIDQYAGSLLKIQKIESQVKDAMDEELAGIAEEINSMFE